MFNPFDLRSNFTLSTPDSDGQQDITSTGAKLFGLIPTRYGEGINVWTAPQGATVAGSASYIVYEHYEVRPVHPILTRTWATSSNVDDMPTAEGVSLSDGVADFAGRPLMAFLGEPLDAMVQNLGQTDNSYVSLGSATNKALSQGFTTGSDEFGYRLQGIGVNIEGSDDSNGNPQVPSGPTSVSVAVHADSSGKPGAKLFDLVSPTEFAAGHSFFEAPPGAVLAPNTSYVLVWRYNRGTWHRLQKTSSNSEDSGAQEGSSIADAFYRGADLGSLSEDSGGNALEFAVYTEVQKQAPFVGGGIEVTKSWFHIPEGVDVGDQFRVLFVTHRATKAMFGNIKHYNDWVKFEAEQTYSNPIIRAVASQFRAVVCTAAVDARTNTGMPAAGHAGVPIHWLDGGWQDRPTLVANSNSQFYGGAWVNTHYGAYVTGNSAYFHVNYMVWTGCDSVGGTHPTGYMGPLITGMVAAGTPRDPDHAPLGPVDPLDPDFVGAESDANRPLYAISPVFTVVAEPAEPVVGSVPAEPVVKISSDSPLVPSGLRSGDRFRLIFLSSTERNAESTNIADYNKFVQDLAAAGHADIRAHSAGFRAVACTEAVDARDNTGTNGIGLGIHWLGGAKAVDNYVDFYDGSWDEEVTVRDESGAAVTIPVTTSQYAAWTGCAHDGIEAFETGDSIALGTTTPGLGSLNHGGNRGPLHQSGGSDPKAHLNYLYGLSYIFEVR